LSLTVIVMCEIRLIRIALAALSNVIERLTNYDAQT
jgi:hypothetical protein